MKLTELIDTIEAHGFAMTGDKSFSQFPPGLLTGELLCAPLGLIPHEPPIEAECVMVPNWLATQEPLDGYVRIEGAAAIAGAVVHLQFVRVQA